MELLETDQIQIVSCATLGSDDYHSLTLLYQPLIGVQAFTLYLVFNSLLERSSLSSNLLLDHKMILKMTNMTLEEFYQARIKLEAIDLLTTYQKNNHYIYLLKIPLTSKQFLKDGSLSVYLESKIEKDSFYKLVDFFKITTIDKKAYTDITKKFDDVFKSDLKGNFFDIDEYLLGRKPNKSIQVSTHQFNYDSFVGGLSRKTIDKVRINNPKFKKTIINLAYTYGFNEETMRGIYLNSITAPEFDYAVLSRKAREHYNFLNKNIPPVLDTVIQSEEEKKYSKIRNMSAESIIRNITGMVPIAMDLNNIQSFYNDSELDRGILNCILMYVLQTKDGAVPGLNYFKKVEADWIKKGLTTIEKACEYLENDNTKKPSFNNSKPKQALKGMDWLDEYRKNINEGVEEL